MVELLPVILMPVAVDVFAVTRPLISIVLVVAPVLLVMLTAFAALFWVMAPL